MSLITVTAAHTPEPRALFPSCISGSHLSFSDSGMNPGPMYPARPSGPLEISPALPVLAWAEAENADQG